jgi:hypothetical protein
MHVGYLGIRGCSSHELGIINEDKRIIYLTFCTKKYNNISNINEGRSMKEKLRWCGFGRNP